jgi:hypothetical protein
MTAPTHNISRKSGDSFQPSWVISFVRFVEPVSYRTSKSPDAVTGYMKTDNTMIIENDCVALSISNSKASFSKSCNMTLKAGEVFYPNAVKPGDWVAVWMVDNEEDKNLILDTLRGQTTKGSKPLNNWDLGLKFLGRVNTVSSTDSVDSGSGSRTISQDITAAAFSELASSIYFTYISKAYFAPSAPAIANGSAAIAPSVASTVFAQETFLRAIGDGFSNKWLDFFTNTPKEGYDPGAILELVLALGLGIDSTKAVGNEKNKGTVSAARGSFHNGIGLPQQVSNIMGFPRSPKKVWEMYEVYTGIQQYENQGSTLGKKFTPKISSSGIFKKCLSPVRGKLTFIPPMWDNKRIWDMANQYSNPVVNELFTSMRVGPDNRIWPTITLRERPFGTGLYNNITTVVQEKINKQIEKSDNKPRGMYATHPRWVIDDSVLLSISVDEDESARVNMVQVWGNTLGGGNSNTTGVSDILANQFAIGNYAIDEQDVARHGLRADIQSTDMDLSPDNTVLLAPKLAKIRADHLFNGQLKWSGSVSLFGLQEPICEGDNVEIRGVVYHIESVNHRVSVSAGGQKTFRTNLSISNGILASSLKSADDVPKYPGELSGKTSDLDNSVGVTDIQFTRQKNRDPKTGLIANLKSPNRLVNKVKKG